MSDPADVARVWREQMAEDVSEFEALTARGVRFARKPRPVASFIVLFLVCACACVAIVGAMVAGRGEVGAVLLLLLPFVLGLAAVVAGYLKRDDQIVFGDSGLTLTRGKTFVARVAWTDLIAVERYWFEFVRVVGRDGRSIWVTGAVEAHESLQNLLVWLPEVRGVVLREGGSLRRGVDSALAGAGISFRFGITDVLREGWRSLLFLLGAGLFLWQICSERASVFQIIVLGLVCVAAAVGGAWFAWRTALVCRRLSDVIVFTDKGVALSSPRGARSVSWRDAAQVEAIRRWPVGGGFHIRDASGAHVIDDEPGFQHRTAARVLLQFMLFREMRAQKTWEHVRALDALRL